MLTGNIAPNAVVKLAAFGLEKWLDLETGAYGSDSEDRTALVPIALGRLASLRGVRLTPDQTWVIGDTPRDYECAEAGGAHCLLVATGSYGLEDLAPWAPMPSCQIWPTRVPWSSCSPRAYKSPRA